MDLDEGLLARLTQLLPAEERERAARFYFQRDRNHFAAARGILRSLLGQYLNLAPGRLCFGYSPYGKPALAAAAGEPPLRFNLSHSHGLALIAVTRGREIGVDVEWIRPDFATEEIAGRFFAPAEVKVMRALPPALQAEAFFNCWTRKEAFIKAHGLGLSLPLNQFEVSLAPGEPAALLSTQFDPPAAARWRLCALEPGKGFAAALAVEGHGWELKGWEWVQPSNTAIAAA